MQYYRSKKHIRIFFTESYHRSTSLYNIQKARWPSWLWRQVKEHFSINFLVGKPAWVQVPLLSTKFFLFLIPLGVYFTESLIFIFIYFYTLMETTSEFVATQIAPPSSLLNAPSTSCMFCTKVPQLHAPQKALAEWPMGYVYTCT